MSPSVSLAARIRPEPLSVIFLPSGEVPAPTEGSVQKERETTRFAEVVEVGGSLGPRVKRLVSVRMLWM